MSTHKGLEKAAEEQARGLAKASPINANPETRNNVGSAMRMDTFAKLLMEFKEDSPEFHAAFKIATVWRLKDNPAGIKSSMRLWGIVGGGKDFDVDDPKSKYATLMAEWNTWWNYMTINRMIDKRSVAIDICAEGKTFVECAIGRNITDKTAKAWAIHAIKVWVEVNRKKPIVIRVFEKYIRKPAIVETKKTRTIVFVDEE